MKNFHNFYARRFFSATHNIHKFSDYFEKCESILKIIESIFRKWTLRWKSLQREQFSLRVHFRKITLVKKLIILFLNKFFKVQNFFIHDKKIFNHFADNLHIILHRSFMQNQEDRKKLNININQSNEILSVCLFHFIQVHFHLESFSRFYVPRNNLWDDYVASMRVHVEFA